MDSFSKITEVAHVFGLLFSPAMYSFYQKMGWAKFWATFLLARLVTLEPFFTWNR
jgi:hypothetical protein